MAHIFAITVPQDGACEQAVPAVASPAAGQPTAHGTEQAQQKFGRIRESMEHVVSMTTGIIKRARIFKNEDGQTRQVSDASESADTVYDAIVELPEELFGGVEKKREAKSIACKNCEDADFINYDAWPWDETVEETVEKIINTSKAIRSQAEQVIARTQC